MLSSEETGSEDEGREDDGSGIEDGSAMDDDEGGALVDAIDEEELPLSFREEHAVMERAQEMASKPAINDFI